MSDQTSAVPAVSGGLRSAALPGLFLGTLAAVAAALVWITFSRQIPVTGWMQTILAPDLDNTAEVIAHFSYLPRISVALLAGAGLAFAGAVLQHVLRNPIAEPATLGIAGGAQLALTIATLWAPWLFAFGREWVALTGAALAFTCVLSISMSRGLSPVSVALAGLIVSLYTGMAGAVVTLFNHDLLIGLFLWGAGYLDQTDWSKTLYLLWTVPPLAFTALLLVRPATLLSLGDSTAKSLGVPVGLIRFLVLGLAVTLTAVIVATVGVISFVGLAAPAAVRMLGVRRLFPQLLLAPVLGALILLITDQLILLLPVTYRAFPTGAMTAILGAPMLLALLPRLKAVEPPRQQAARTPYRAQRPALILGGLTVALCLMLALSLTSAGSNSGLLFGHMDEVSAFRLPRALAALSGGMSLALAGVILQRMTANPLASPEVLGISSGAILGVIAVMILMVAPNRLDQIAGGMAGALAVLLVIVLLTRKQAFSGTRLLLAGIAMGSVTGLIMAVLKTFQDPRLGQLLTWVSGSVYGTSLNEALTGLTLALAALALLPLISRWLTLMPLGTSLPRSVGVQTARANLLLLLIVAVLSASATLTIGPLSFIGIMAPHFARYMGLVRSGEQAIGATLAGGLVLLAADWIGRTVIFPYQVPAGLLTAMLGGPVLLYLIRKRS